MEWILICNYNYYDLIGAFRTLNEITWPQFENMAKGDIVYCYVTNPYRAVLFKCEITETHLNHMDDSAKGYVKHALFYENKQLYMRLVCREKYPADKFTDVILKENGLESLQLTSRVSAELSQLFHSDHNQSVSKRKSGKAVLLIGAVALLGAIVFGGIYAKNILFPGKPPVEIQDPEGNDNDKDEYHSTKTYTESFTAQRPDGEIVLNSKDIVEQKIERNLKGEHAWRIILTTDGQDSLRDFFNKNSDAELYMIVNSTVYSVMHATDYKEGADSIKLELNEDYVADFASELGISMDENTSNLVSNHTEQDNNKINIPCSITISGDGIASAIDAIRAGFPAEKEYPDENNVAISGLIEDYYSVSVTNDPDMIFDNLSNLFIQQFDLQTNQIQGLAGIDRVFTVTGLDDESCLSYFSFHVNCNGCDVPVPGIGCVYMLLNEDGIGIADLSDGNVQEYITKMTTGGSWFSDKVNDLYLLQTSEYTYLDQNTVVNEVKDERIDLISYFTHSFSSLVNEVPDLSKTKENEGEVKWENDSLSVTGTSSDYIVRAHVFGADKYSVYGIYIGMPEDDMLEQLTGYMLVGTNADGWTLTASGTDADAIQIAYKLSQGKVSDLYVAINGYMPIKVN